MEPVLKWLENAYPNTQIFVRADSVFSTLELYYLCDAYDASFLIRLKANATLKKYAEDALSTFTETYASDYTKHHVMYDEFPYQAGSWKAPLRVICRIERAAGELLPRATFVVTTLKAEAKVIVKTYNKRGNMENFIKEAKIDFSMETVSHCSFTANAVKCLTKALAYSIVNGMKCTATSKDRKSSRMLSIRTDLVKIACRVVVSARRTTFKLCSSSPFKDVFYQVMQSIEKLQFVSLQA